MRMQVEKWWKGRLRRVAASWREHLQIALANVSKKHTPYASSMTVSEWREQKRRTREFLKDMELEDEEGNRISLIEKYDGSVANPANEYGEETVRIKGVYATEVGEDTPILTRLAQWKIVPKRAVDLGFDFKDADASSRSSVNNCTGGLRSEDSNQPESFAKFDLESMSRKERRQLLNRIRAERPEKRHLKLRRSDKIETACDKVIGR